MKVSILRDEWYPVYVIEKDLEYGIAVDIPNTIYKKYEKALKEFGKVQGILKSYHKE